MITPSSQTDLAQIFDALETGIILYGPVFTPGNDFEPSDFVISYCNREAAEMTGVSLDTMRSQRPQSSINVPEDGRRTLFRQINARKPTSNIAQ